MGPSFVFPAVSVLESDARRRLQRARDTRDVRRSVRSRGVAVPRDSSARRDTPGHAPGMPQGESFRVTGPAVRVGELGSATREVRCGGCT